MSAPTAPTRLRLATGMAVRLVLPEIAVGGEGVVYGVVQPRDHVVKLYHAKVIAQKGALLQAKLRAMAHNPPADPTAGRAPSPSSGRRAWSWTTGAPSPAS